MNWLMAHLVGDYLWQNDWMAQNKKKATLPCLVHCALYTSAIAMFTFRDGWGLAAWAAVFAMHFVQDRTKIVNWLMQMVGQREFAKPPLAPWSIIVVDNTLHLLVLYGIDEHVRQITQ